MSKSYQLTIKDEHFANKTADHINKKYPGTAWVEKGCCFTTGEYYEYCQQYVIENCNIKG